MKKIFDYPEEAPPTIQHTINAEANQLPFYIRYGWVTDLAFWLLFFSIILYIIVKKVIKYKKNKAEDLPSMCKFSFC